MVELPLDEAVGPALLSSEKELTERSARHVVARCDPGHADFLGLHRELSELQRVTPREHRIGSDPAAQLSKDDVDLIDVARRGAHVHLHVGDPVAGPLESRGLELQVGPSLSPRSVAGPEDPHRLRVIPVWLVGQVQELIGSHRRGRRRRRRAAVNVLIPAESVLLDAPAPIPVALPGVDGPGHPRGEPIDDGALQGPVIAGHDLKEGPAPPRELHSLLEPLLKAASEMLEQRSLDEVRDLDVLGVL